MRHDGTANKRQRGGGGGGRMPSEAHRWGVIERTSPPILGELDRLLMFCEKPCCETPMKEGTFSYHGS